MASSRWKRFGFFDRNTLNVPPAVLEDLLPDQNVTTSGRRLPGGASELSMAVTTAGLPKNLQAELDKNAAETAANANNPTTTYLSAMLSSLTACGPSVETIKDTTLRLDTTVTSTTTESTATDMMDGLVLTFLSSPETDLVHCMDMTVRCTSSLEEKQDLDGWRGYWAPFAAAATTTSQQSGSSMGLQDRIMTEHLQQPTAADRIVHLATCRSSTDGDKLMVVCVSGTNIVVQLDPHLYLNCRLPISHSADAQEQQQQPVTIPLVAPWNTAAWGKITCVDLVDGGHVAVGTDTGMVVLWTRHKSFLRQWIVIPAPGGSSSSLRVENLQLTTHFVNQHASQGKLALFVSHAKTSPPTAAMTTSSPRSTGGGGLCCYDLGSVDKTSTTTAPLARHDLDSRPAFLVDRVSTQDSLIMVARPDGLYTYSQTQKVGVAPIDGTKLAICAVPSLTTTTTNATTAYALVASTDVKSGRDAVDIYDATNKLVAFHVLLSPGHKALKAAGIRAAAGGRSSAIVVTSGGSIVTLTEKPTAEKVSLLVQKSLYGASISMAYADSTFPPNSITNLYCKHAEHLYRKGDFTAAMDQYIYTIGSLESSHVILRYLDAPKIPMLAKYLETLIDRKLATDVHKELLKTCYLKLNDTEAAEKLLLGFSSVNSGASSISNLATYNPKEALITLCTLEAPQAAEALVVHGAALARASPKETAGIVISLCVGTYSPSSLADVATQTEEASKLLEHATDDRPKVCQPYPVQLFTSAFLENPKTLRLLLAHCNRNKCYLSPALRRTLLELTLDEWKTATKNGDTEAEKLRRKEAITALTDAHCREIGDHDALVICQLAGFAEGELLLYERLQMVPMLLAHYAQDGGDRARRQMLAMCRKDPEILADVLGHFVSIAGETINHEADDSGDMDSVNSEEEEILDDIRETLALARSQRALPPVRIARILAGEGIGQFSASSSHGTGQTAAEGEDKNTVPLSVALDYVGDILDESRREISRLRAEVEEYNELCNNMEQEVETLLCGGAEKSAPQGEGQLINIEEMYTRLRAVMEDPHGHGRQENRTEQAREAFWREMNQSDDRFETICRFISKGIIQ